MPYQSEVKLTHLINQALHAPDIQKGLVDTNLSSDVLRDEIRNSADEVWEVAAQQIREYDARENDLKLKIAEVQKSLPPMPPHHEYVNPPDWAVAIGLTGLAILILVLIAFTLSLFVSGWRSVFASLWATAIVKIGIGLAALGPIYLYVRGQLYEYRARKQKKWDRLQSATLQNPGVIQLREELDRLGQSIDAALLEKAIKEKMRSGINRWLTPSYEPQLNIAEAPGLAEVIDPSRTIDTASKNSLRFLLESMPGGSIGIAGPRGAGKSTLIQSYCGRKRTIHEIKGRKVLSIVASAPVHYEARDFILYLFSACCQAVLEFAGTPDTAATLGTGDEVGRPPTDRLIGLLLTRVRPRALFLTGLFFILWALYLPVWSAFSPSGGTTTQPSSSAEPRPAAEQSGSIPKTPLASQRQSEPAGVRFIRALDIKSGPMLLLGVLLLLASNLLRNEYVRAEMREAIARYNERERSKEEGEEQRRLRSKGTLQRSDLSPSQQRQLDTACKDARAWLKRIRFQQSFTSGWSGALKLPVGLEGGANSAVTLAQNQLTTPEIVASFSQFLSRIPEGFQIIIGIDELDKLESDEQAQRFLNEIKSIFGLPGCFYLISVSEGAMSSFEQRGLPFRDVFDSSFDSIVYVDYLDREAALNLLERRVVGRPAPFFCLAYCMSGGLARDLIRVFRHLLELRQNDPKNNDLSSMCLSLIRAEIKAKVRAVAVSAKKIELEQAVVPFLSKLYQLEGETISLQSLSKTLQDLLTWRATISSSLNGSEESEEIVIKHKKIRSLIDELSAFIYFALTILEFFNNSLGKEALMRAEERRDLEKLARSRQALTIDPSITIALLNDFRRVQMMTVPDFLT